ncbi:MAG: hypothetical protein K6T65_08780 [Peptococcaceae bacterium]|nr:hypothetical protein [Peptococcaceae bacterium]
MFSMELKEIESKIIEYKRSERPCFTRNERDNWLNFFRELGWYAYPDRDKFTHPITVYRGGVGKEVRDGISWTINKLCAIWFAGRRKRGWFRNDPSEPVVYKATAPPEAIFAYISHDKRRNWLGASEQEVILDPALLQNIETIKPDFSVFDTVKVAWCESVFNVAHFGDVFMVMIEDKLAQKIKKQLLTKPDIQKLLNKYRNYRLLKEKMYNSFNTFYYEDFMIDEEEEDWENNLKVDCPKVYKAYKRLKRNEYATYEECLNLIKLYLPDKTEQYIDFAWRVIKSENQAQLSKKYENLFNRYILMFNNSPVVKKYLEFKKELDEFLETFDN